MKLLRIKSDRGFTKLCYAYNTMFVVSTVANQFVSRLKAGLSVISNTPSQVNVGYEYISWVDIAKAIRDLESAGAKVNDVKKTDRFSVYINVHNFSNFMDRYKQTDSYRDSNLSK